MKLTDYKLLGRSGLRVSPLSLGTMTFGPDWGWGADRNEARRIFDLYIDRGGNFIDTSVNYTDGASERFVGEFIGDKRERVVLATKFTMAREAGNPNSGGNHRLNMVRSVEHSLRQLSTDRIDLFYLHGWDMTTGPDEVMRGLDDLVRSGKIVYVGICNTPAWRIAEMQMLADMRGWSPFVALQIEYSLVERTVEHELMPMAAAMGLGVLPWSPLGGGVLAGKYTKADVRDSRDAAVSASRKGVIASSGHLNERAIDIAQEVRAVAEESGSTPSQVALAWTLMNPTVVSPIVGARTLAQAEENLGALDVALSPEQLDRLNLASEPAAIFPARFVDRPLVQQLFFGGRRCGASRLSADEKSPTTYAMVPPQTQAFLPFPQIEGMEMSIIQLTGRLARTSLALMLASAFLVTIESTADARTGAPTGTEARDTPVETRNKAIVQAAFEKWRAGGDVFAELLAPDIVWTIQGSGPVAGTYRGLKDFSKRASGPLVSRLTGPVVPEVRSIWADGDVVIVRFDGSATTTSGAPYRNQFVWILRMAGGRVVEAEAFLDLIAYQQVVENNEPRVQ